MSFKAKDGKQFGNIFRQRKHDEMHGVMMPKAGKEKEMPEKMEVEAPKPHEVVAEHGKAKTVHIEHDHEGGKHSLTSMHEDGHEHKSEHESAEEAHDHGKQLAADITDGVHGPDEQGSMSMEDAENDWA